VARLPQHDGFYIPNASDPDTHPRMAEPDKIDFSTAANSRWGVISDCQVTCSGTVATASAGYVLIDGRLIPFPGSQVTLTGGDTSDRFDLLAVKSDSTLALLRGTPAVDPVFPDVPEDCTVLAAVFCPTGSADYSLNVIDKRRFVPKALLTKLAANGQLIRNVNGSGDYFAVLGDGSMTWLGDTAMWRSAPETLSIRNHLDLDGSLDAGGQVTGGTVYGRGGITGWNLYFGDTAPQTAPLGALWQKTDGKLFLATTTGWQEIATLNGTVPTGTVIQSVEVPGVMEPLGWLQLKGQFITEDKYARLFTLQALQRFISVDPGGGPRRMELPNATGRFLRSSTDPPGTPGGRDSVVLTTTNLPKHNHSVAMAYSGGFFPTVSVTPNGAHKHGFSQVAGNMGEHSHSAEDRGHGHHLGGLDVNGNLTGAFVCLAWGGLNKIDALFNDRNHTYSVMSAEWTNTGFADIRIASAGSGHIHDLMYDGEHTHGASISPVPDHKHSLSENDVGGDGAFDITPSYLTVYTYLRS
jgi:microcystin-dependent protein